MNKTTKMGLMLGSNIIAAFALGIGGGIILDNRFDSSPKWTLIGIGASFIVVLIQLFQFVRLTQKDANKSIK